MSQMPLPLDGGHHVGPLFIVSKRRPARHIGTDGSRRIHGMVRRQAERRATPPWCDTKHVRDFYRLARIYTKVLGVRYSAEHLVPLCNPIVCGLHVPANMAVLTLEENVRKGNSTWPDLPESQAVLL